MVQGIFASPWPIREARQTEKLCGLAHAPGDDNSPSRTVLRPSLRSKPPDLHLSYGKSPPWDPSSHSCPLLQHIFNIGTTVVPLKHKSGHVTLNLGTLYGFLLHQTLPYKALPDLASAQAPLLSPTSPSIYSSLLSGCVQKLPELLGSLCLLGPHPAFFSPDFSEACSSAFKSFLKVSFATRSFGATPSWSTIFLFLLFSVLLPAYNCLLSCASCFCIASSSGLSKNIRSIRQEFCGFVHSELYTRVWRSAWHRGRHSINIF